LDPELIKPGPELSVATPFSLFSLSALAAPLPSTSTAKGQQDLPRAPHVDSGLSTGGLDVCVLPSAEARGATELSAVSPLHFDAGGTEVKWNVHARRLKGTEKVLVSPSFELPGTPGSFKIMLHATPTSAKWGGASFKNAKGKGVIDVKWVPSVPSAEKEPDEACDLPMAFEVSIGGREVDGPRMFPGQRVTHNFAYPVCRVTRDNEEWDFLEAAADTKQTFWVCLKLSSAECK
jgi:hypothetical protein